MIYFESAPESQTLEGREKGRLILSPKAVPGTVFLATCDRVELYGGSGRVPGSVVRHLFRVASGLESPYLGENSILGQVREAYRQAQEKGDLSPGLHRLFQRALKVGKLIRSHTDLNKGALGHSQGVIEILESTDLTWETAGILLIGVNKLSKAFLRWLTERKAQTLILGNRTLEKARNLVQGTDVEVLPLSHIHQVWDRVDVVISMTSAPHLILKENQVPEGRRRWMFDLASPRDLDPAFRFRKDVHFYDLGDVEEVTAKTLRSRRAEALKATALVDQEVQSFLEDQTRRFLGNPFISIPRYGTAFPTPARSESPPTRGLTG